METIDYFYITMGVLGAYLIGSVPTSVWIGKGFYGVDVREHGSGNAGATNTFRVLGRVPGTSVLILDTAKGAAGVLSAVILYRYFSYSGVNYDLLKVLTGSAAVVGHIFPIWARFRGGKGVATLLGVGLMLHPAVTLICAGIFLVVLIISKYVSLGAIVAAFSFPLLFLLPNFHSENHVFVIFGGVIFVGVLITHGGNIKRLINGNENKIYLFGKKRVK